MTTTTSTTTTIDPVDDDGGVVVEEVEGEREGRVCIKHALHPPLCLLRERATYTGGSV